MRMSSVFVDYLLWHYTVAFRDIVVIWLNFVWFVLHFFSIPLLLRTLFAPWKRVSETYERTGFEDLLATFVVNVMTRIVGVIIRLAFIIIGLLFLSVLSVGLLFWLIVWILVPFLTVYSLIYGFLLIL